MILTTIDWIIIFAYFLITLTISIYYSKRAGQSTAEFFLTGRNLPWWIAGTTMVATTFAADTPLAVTELVAKNGIAGNWLWWNMLFGGMLTVFFFARLWRRAGIMTDVEFVEIRYSGKPAAFLRGFRALYLGVFMNVIIMGWVNLAMVKILTVLFPGSTFFGMTEFSVIGLTFSASLLWVGLIMVLVAIYSSLAGLWGVSITDVLQFTLAMIGSITLAVIAVNHVDVGGMSGLMDKLPGDVFRFLPMIGASGETGNVLSLTLVAFIAYLGVQWWASWYPGAEPGGGGYVAQRMMSAKDEKHSLLATLWFTVAHYAIRPWPWVLVALVSLVLYPELSTANKGNGFVMVMRDVLPAGLLGILFTAFLAAYMSTISTQLNWGTSYIVNDFLRRFYGEGKTEKDFVRWSRIVTVILMIISLILTSMMNRISDAWIFILECSAGIGLVLVLRWFWWRINAWSEITAMVAPFIIYPIIHSRVEFPYTLFFIVGWSTLCWLVVTLFTRPTHMDTLESFYRRVHPGGIGWRFISDQFPEIRSDAGYGGLFIGWIAGSVLVYSSLFAVGSWLFGKPIQGSIMALVAILSGVVIFQSMSRIGWETVTE